MFTKTMKFDDLDGNEVEQTFYFNYNKKEIAELLEFGRVLKFKKPGDPDRLPLEEQMKVLGTPREVSGLTNQQNNETAYAIFQDLILDAYGQKAADNRGFDKTWEHRTYFENHNAFPEMIFEFLGNEPLAAEFFEKCLPPRLVEQVKAEQKRQETLKVTDTDIDKMSEEAAARQADPATRIEPGVMPEGADPVIVATARNVAESQVKKVEDLTEADILALSDEDFKKLDPKKLSQEQMVVAFRRKLAG